MSRTSKHKGVKRSSQSADQYLMIERRTQPGSPPDFERVVAGMVLLRRFGYGAAAIIAVIGGIATRDAVWAYGIALAILGFFAGTGFSDPRRRLVVGLAIDQIAALSLWWMLGPETAIDLLPIVIVSLSAFILPLRHAVFSVVTGLIILMTRIPFNLAGSDAVLPMYWANDPIPTSEVAVSVLVLTLLAVAAAGIFYVVGRLLTKSQDELKRSATRYRSLIEASPDGVLIHQQGAMKFLNSAAASMLGYHTPSAGLDRPYLDHVSRKDRAAETARMEAVAAGVTTEPAEIQLCHTDGSTQVAEVIGIPTELEGQPATQVIMRDVSTRHALQNTQRLLEAAFDGSVSAMAVVDLKGNYLRVNRAQCELFGYSEAQFLEMNWRDLTHPDDLEESEETTKKMATRSDDDSFTMVKRYLRADGQSINAISTLTLVRDSEGQPAYTYSNVSDLSEVTAAQEASRASEKRYRKLFEGIPVALYRSTPEGDILDANPALVELMGFDAREGLLDLKPHLIYADPNERTKWKEAIDRDGTIFGFETQLRRKDGSTFWSQDSARIVRGVDGQILYYEGAIIDVTAQKLAEQAQQRLTRIIEATPDIVIVLDQSGWVTYANTAARHQFSIDENQQPPYLHISQAVDAERMRILIQDVIPMLTEGEAWTGELILTAPDGSALPVSVVGLAHFSESGELARFSAVLRDVSEQVETTRQLEDLVRTKDEFVASVSHELRTPLTAVVGLAQELRDHWKVFDEAELEDLIRLIADQGTEVSAIVQDLLVAARADIGSITIDPTTIQIADEVDAVLKTIPGEFVEGLNIEIESVTAWADAGRFRQIVRNLITNAVRYGGPNVQIRAQNAASGAILSVVDDGAGIAPDDQQHIFDPYFRAHDTPTQPASVGLGLTVSRQLAELMNGELTYEYADGFSTFNVTLPTDPVTQFST